MSAHIDDELPLLLTGEADRATVHAAAAHLRTCEDCQQELVSALVAHASLSSAARFAPDLLADLPRPADLDSSPHPSAEEPSLPDLSAVFAQIRGEADAELADNDAGDDVSFAAATPTPAAVTRRPSHRGRWLVAAAAAGVLVAGGAVVVAQQTASGSAHKSFSLAAFDRGTTSAKGTIVGDDRLEVDAASLPNPGSGTRYEVWLTDSARKNLQPLGWVGANGKGSYPVPADLLGHFDNVEVSVQQVAAPYQFSGVSVLRGSYS